MNVLSMEKKVVHQVRPSMDVVIASVIWYQLVGELLFE
jgi:hypothetical protein